MAGAAALTAAAEAYQELYNAELAAASTTAERVTLRVLSGGATDAAEEQLAAVWPQLLAPLQERAGLRADAYVEQQGRIVAVTDPQLDPLRPTPATIVPELVDTIVTPDTPSMRSPTLRMRRLLGEGASLGEALQQTSAYASQLAEAALRASEQAGASDGYRRHWKSGAALRWQRVPSAGACGWCRVVADRLYSDLAAAQGAGWHASCHCSWRTLSQEESDAWERELGRGEWKDVVAEPSDPEAFAAAQLRQPQRPGAPPAAPRRPPRETPDEWAERSLEGLSDEQLDALGAYTTGRYHSLNRVLRGLDEARPDDLALGDTVQAALEVNPTTVPMTVYREVNDAALGIRVHRDDPADWLGRSFEDHAFFSTTRDAGGIGRGSNLTLTVNVPPGTPAAHVQRISLRPEENEVLLSRGLRYIIREITPDPSGRDHWSVVVDVLPRAGAA